MLSLASLSILNSVLVKRARDAIVLTYLGAIAYLVLSSMSLLLLDPSLGVAGWPATDTWQSPVTVQDVVAWINSGNVFVQLSQLFEKKELFSVF